MKQKTLALACALVISAFTTIASANITLIHAGKLLAVPGEAPASGQTVVVENQKIVEVRDGYVSASEFDGDVRVVNLKDSFVMPGLMDMHVHLQFELGPHNDIDELKMPTQVMQMRSVHYGMKTLMAGFTTVRDVGSSEQEMYALRDAIDNGWVDGPRIIAAGGVGITGGHGDVSGLAPQWMELLDTPNVCNGPYDCRRATRRSIKFGAEWIKITSTGGVLTDRATGTGQQMEMDELKEVVRSAARMGRKVASHAHQEDGIIAALEAGVASIEHGTYTGKAAIKLFKKTGAYLVPTLLAGETVKRMAMESDFMSPAIKQKSITVGADMMKNFGAVYNAGVKIAYGTDSGVSIHGTNAEEALLMHEAGMPAEEILVSATINAADLLGMSDSIGTIEGGKYADIIAIDGSPLDNIAELLDVDFVMKGGKVYKNQ